jgi:hypothetical protein
MIFLGKSKKWNGVLVAENIKNKTKLSYTVIMVVNISTTLNETNNQLPPLTTNTKKTTAYMSLEIQVLAWNRRIMWLS